MSRRRTARRTVAPLFLTAPSAMAAAVAEEFERSGEVSLELTKRPDEHGARWLSDWFKMRAAYCERLLAQLENGEG